MRLEIKCHRNHELARMNPNSNLSLNNLGSRRGSRVGEGGSPSRTFADYVSTPPEITRTSDRMGIVSFPQTDRRLFMITNANFWGGHAAPVLAMAPASRTSLRDSNHNRYQ